MTEIKASLKHLKISPRKVRLLADLVRGMPLKTAKLQLSVKTKKSSEPILKLLKSAESNAKHNFKLAAGDNLYIKEIRVDEGRKLKRYLPRAMGRATVIRKRTSHVSLILTEKI